MRYKFALLMTKYNIRYIYSCKDGDITFSTLPLSSCSISTALAMTYAGARGETAIEMCHTCGYDDLDFNIQVRFRETLQSMTGDQSQQTLMVVNGVFVRRGYRVLNSFRSTIYKCYAAIPEELDFYRSPSESAQHINDWIARRTDNKIREIVSGEDVKMASLAVVNAIYFKGSWEFPFTCTRQATFHTSHSESITVDMMIKTARLRYAIDPHLGCQIVELPYSGNRIAMYILLPEAMEDITSLEAKLTADSVTAALANLRSEILSVAIPRFKMTVDVELPRLLKAMGMKRAFEQSANFSGMSHSRPLWVSDVIHKAYIGVDEKGTEATAATVVVTRWKSRPIPVFQNFVADHPFVFLIRDNETGSILFLGRFVNPRA